MPERFSAKTVPTLEGENLIATIHQHNVQRGLGLAYHGGKLAVQQLRASIPCWTDDGVEYKDSPLHVVCALTNPLPPVFYALAPRGHRKYSGTENGGILLSLRRSVAGQVYAAQGYVAVLSCDESFTLFQGGPPEGWPGELLRRVPELRSTLDQTPLCNVKVSFLDLLQLLAGDPTSNLEFFT